MKLVDALILTVLTILAALIWVVDRSWLSMAGDVLPVMVGLSLAIWMGWPWQLSKSPAPPRRWMIVAGVLLMSLGSGLEVGMVTCMSIGWCLLFYAWLCMHLESHSLATAWRLLPMVLMSFPWVSIDLQQPVGWWFQLSGAAVASGFFQMIAVDVSRQGVHMVVGGQPWIIDASCAGMHTLQTMMIGGTAAAFLVLGKSVRYWWSIPLLLLFSWLANTLRIIFLVGVGLAFGREAAAGWFHNYGGFLVVFLTFLLSWGCFRLIKRGEERSHG